MCLGNPNDDHPTCDREGTVSLLQLRPDHDGQPVLVWITCCPHHAPKVRKFMARTWPNDDVDTYGTRFLLDHPEWQRPLKDLDLVHAAGFTR